MNIKEYIESGLLEAYVLGALSPEETREVAENIARYPELAAEVAAIEMAAIQFASMDAPALPKGLEDKIWNSMSTHAANAGGDDEVVSNPKVIPFTPEYRKPVQWKLAAAVAGLVGSLALNAVLWNNKNDAGNTSVALTARMDSLSAKQQQLAALVDDYQKAKLMMSDTGMQTIVMHTMQKGHPMAATLYWSKEKAEAYVSVDGLPPPPAGMQYQLWVIQGGKPVSMGVLPNSMANTPSIQKIGMRIESGEAFAISLEKAGGSPTPTMEQIYVLGKA